MDTIPGILGLEQRHLESRRVLRGGECVLLCECITLSALRSGRLLPAAAALLLLLLLLLLILLLLLCRRG